MKSTSETLWWRKVSDVWKEKCPQNSPNLYTQTNKLNFMQNAYSSLKFCLFASLDMNKFNISFSLLAALLHFLG